MGIWQHFKTITRHKLLVMKYCFRIGLYKQGLLHDLSKYSWTEFSVGCKYYQGNRSPNNAEREATGLSTAWIHHYGRNKHHFEHWVDYGIHCDTIIHGVPMPRKYIAEMVADRISASRNYHPDTYTDEENQGGFLEEGVLVQEKSIQVPPRTLIILTGKQDETLWGSGSILKRLQGTSF